jgi:threonine-phosphate decarboxylase
MPLAAHGGDIYGAARRLGVSPHRILDFSASINPLGLSPKASRRLLREMHTVCHYPDQRQQELRALVASREQIDPGSIVFGNGATQLLYVVTRCFRPREAMLIAPGFSEYRAALSSVQARHSEFPLRSKEGFRLNTDAFLRSLTVSKPDCILLANPNNPTGAVIAHDDLQRLAAICHKSRQYLIIDESFIDFTEEQSLSKLAARNPRLIVIRSLTKFFALPGLRIGYLVAHRSVAKAIAAAVEPWSVNTLALAAAAESMKDRSYRRRTLALVAKEREYLLSGLEKFDWLEAYPSRVNFLLVRLKPKKLRGDVLCYEMEQMQILIRDSNGFGGLGSQFVRIAVRSRMENLHLLQALDVVAKHSLELRKR